MQEEIATTRDGYEDDGFVVDELEEDEIEITDEGMSEDEEDKEKRREERRRRKEEKELRRAEREKKKKTRKLVNVGDAVDDNQDIMEYDVINDEMNYEEEEEEDVNDENMVEVYDKYLEPYDKSKMQEEERIMDFMKINCPERLYFRKSVLNRQNSEFNENLDDSEWEDRRKLEADWIYKKLLLDLSRPTDLNGFINEVLKLMYVDLHEIMYIFTYDKDAIYQFFGEDWKIVNETHVLEMLWNVWRLDLEYFEFNKKRQSVINALQNISEIERVNYSRLLDNAVLDVELEMVREEFSLLFLSDTFDPLRRVTKNRKNYTDLLNYNLKEFVNAFGITPQQLSDNFKYGYKNSVPRPPYEEPEQIARRLVSNDLKTPKHVINAAKTLYMVELAHTYDFKKKILEFALDNAFLTTSPTPKGETEIDVYHKYAIIKRLADKPVKDFKNISKILEIFEAEKEGLVTVSFSLPNAIGDVVSVFTSDDDSNAWKSLKQETIDTMFKHFINPFIDTELRQQLRKEAVQCVIKEAQSSLKKRVFVQPHFKLTPKRNVLESRETDETVGGIVFGLNSVMVVVVNSVSKEFVDSLFLDPFVYRYEKYQKKLSDFFKLHKTVLIGIEANSPKSVFLFNKMHEDDGSDNSIRGLFNDVVYVNKDLGTIYKLEVTGESEQLIYSGVSLCRQLIDPLAEFVHIASAEDRIFSVQLHSLQNVLVGSERGSYYSGLNESLMEFVNIHGVNINDCIDYDHYKNMLQFVCGYSKLRSDNLLVNLKKFSYNVPSRDFLSKLYIRDGFSTISTNAIGFLIITPDYSKKDKFLDQTRIHFSKYDIARQIVFDAADETVSSDENKFNETVIRTGKEGYDTLDLESFADELKKQKMGNIRISLDFIVDELLNPFKDKRPKFNPMHDYEIFKCVTNESPDDFKIGQPIDFVLKPSTKGRGQITNCLEVVINSYDTPNNSFDTRNDQVRPMNGRIDKVDLERCVIVVNCNEKWQTPDINRLYDELINKERCLQVLEKERRMESKEQNQSNNYMNVKDKYFKIASYSQAVAEISRNYVGSWMIIPIEEGGLFSNKLKIIWKWSSSVISNINVKEIEKRRDRIGKIQIGDNIYDDLEDCRKRYIEVVNQYLNEVRQHRKYHNDDSLVDNEILRKKFENPSVFQYRFSFSKEKSGNIRLSFIPGSKTIVNEFISVSEKGFTRNGNTYTDLDSLADAFKQEIMKLSQQ